MSASTVAGYEVDAEMVEVRDEDGHRYFLGRGQELPDWVSDQDRQRLLAAGHVVKFGVI